MADVFVSWCSLDETTAMKVVTALQTAQLDVWWSKDGMGPGDCADQRVLEELRKARVAIFLLSDNALLPPRFWVTRELTWCEAEISRPGARLEKVVAVSVGPLSPANYPLWITQRQAHVFECFKTQAPEKAIEELALKVRELLRLPLPIVVNATLVAMTRRQFEDVREHHADELAKLCAVLGVPGLEHSALAPRYHEESAQFEPFPGMTVHALIQRILHTLNERRALVSMPPLKVQWLENCFLDASTPTNRRNAETAWQKNDTLLVVDAVSTCSPVQQRLLQRLPQKDHKRTAILFIPPHSRTMGGLTEDHLESSFILIRQIFSALQAFERTCTTTAFELATLSSIAPWLHDALAALEAKPSARKSVVRGGPGFDPTRDFHQDD